jgi:hypothetical protein
MSHVFTLFVLTNLNSIMLSCFHRPLAAVVRKNLAGHRTRNRKTAQMFTICMAFIIFAGTLVCGITIDAS